MESPALSSRYRGALLGLAIGDALGTTLEQLGQPSKSDLASKSKWSEGQLTDIVGGGPFHLLPGQWTDGMERKLCLYCCRSSSP